MGIRLHVPVPEQEGLGSQLVVGRTGALQTKLLGGTPAWPPAESQFLTWWVARRGLPAGMGTQFLASWGLVPISQAPGPFLGGRAGCLWEL